MDGYDLTGLVIIFLCGVVAALFMTNIIRDSPDESQIKAFTQLCNKFDVQVTDNEYRLSCDKGFIVVGSKGYLMASEILKNQTKK